MTRLFSPSTKGFYLRSVHGSSVPADAVEISEGEYRKLIEAPADGMRVDVDQSGAVVAVDAIPQPHEQPIKSVSPIQALTALDNAGLLATLDAYMQDPATPLLVRRSYVAATEWKRNSLLIMNTAIVLGLNDSEIDQLFVAASQVNV